MALLDILFAGEITSKTFILEEADVLLVIPEINRHTTNVENRKLLVSRDDKGVWSIKFATPSKQMKALVKSLTATYKLELTADDSNEIVRLVRK